MAKKIITLSLLLLFVGLHTLSYAGTPKKYKNFKQYFNKLEGEKLDDSSDRLSRDYQTIERSPFTEFLFDSTVKEVKAIGYAGKISGFEVFVIRKVEVGYGDDFWYSAQDFILLFSPSGKLLTEPFAAGYEYDNDNGIRSEVYFIDGDNKLCTNFYEQTNPELDPDSYPMGGKKIFTIFRNGDILEDEFARITTVTLIR